MSVHAGHRLAVGHLDGLGVEQICDAAEPLLAERTDPIAVVEDHPDRALGNALEHVAPVGAAVGGRHAGQIVGGRITG